MQRVEKSKNRRTVVKIGRLGSREWNLESGIWIGGLVGISVGRIVEPKV
jgi:hypothetical protein